MISYNVQPLAVPNLTGIGNYAREVLNCLLPISEEYELHVFDFLARNGAPDVVTGYLGESNVSGNLKVVKGLPLSVYIRMGKWGRIIPYKKLAGSQADLAVFFNYLTPAGLKEKNVITIYDMVCERFPETMDDRNRRLLQGHLQDSADRSSAIVTISEFSKREIMEMLNVPEEKIFVAQCGTDVSYYKPASEAETIEEKKILKDKWQLDDYIFYVGTLEPRKNTKVLVEAFEQIALKYPELKLVLAGGVGWHAEQTLATIDNSMFKDRIIRPGYISNEEKRMLLRNSKVFVFPSIYEGFGMPVTEAMACGTPCVIANTSSLPEASCGLAAMAQPHDVSGFAREITGILEGEFPHSRESLIEAASKFSWENAAKAYMQAINYAKGAENN